MSTIKIYIQALHWDSSLSVSIISVGYNHDTAVFRHFDHNFVELGVRNTHFLEQFIDSTVDGVSKMNEKVGITTENLSMEMISNFFWWDR